MYRNKVEIQARSQICKKKKKMAKGEVYVNEIQSYECTLFTNATIFVFALVKGGVLSINIISTKGLHLLRSESAIDCLELCSVRFCGRTFGELCGDMHASR